MGPVGIGGRVGGYWQRERELVKRVGAIRGVWGPTKRRETSGGGGGWGLMEMRERLEERGVVFGERRGERVTK